MTGGRALLPALLLAAVTATLSAQPARQERRTVTLHAGLLADLWQTSRDVAPERLAALDAALAARPSGNPFGPLIETLARHADVEADLAYIVRRMVHPVALPEVVDPTVFEDEEGTTPYRLHVTLASPFVLAATEPLAFALELRDAKGALHWQHRIEAASAEDLGQLAVKLAVPVTELADGPYTLRVRTDLGADVWQEGDPEARVDVFVQRGFAASTRALDERAHALLEGATAAVRGAVRGAMWPLQRIYGGDAGEGYDAFLADQRNAARVVDNVGAGRSPLAGVEGFASVAVELGAGEPPPQARLRVRPAVVADGARAGLVLFVPGDPSWDGVWLRPSLARAMPPGFLARALATHGFDAARAHHLAVMESPGDMRMPGQAVRAVLDALTALLPVDPACIVLIGERDGASAILAAWQTGSLSAPPRGLALVAHAGIGRGDAARVAATPLLLVPGRGHASGENLVRAAAQLAEAGVGEQVKVLDARHAWPWALLHALGEVEAFCAARLR